MIKKLKRKRISAEVVAEVAALVRPRGARTRKNRVKLKKRINTVIAEEVPGARVLAAVPGVRRRLLGRVNTRKSRAKRKVGRNIGKEGIVKVVVAAVVAKAAVIVVIAVTAVILQKVYNIADIFKMETF